MHLIEICLPSAAASFLGYGKEKTFFIKWEEKTLPQLKPKQTSLEHKAFSGVLLCYPLGPVAEDPKSICLPIRYSLSQMLSVGEQLHLEVAQS